MPFVIIKKKKKIVETLVLILVRLKMQSDKTFVLCTMI